MLILLIPVIKSIIIYDTITFQNFAIAVKPIKRSTDEIKDYKEKILELKSIFFNLNPSLMLWIIVLSLATATASALILPVLKRMVYFITEYQVTAWKIISLSIFLSLFGIAYMKIAAKEGHIMTVVEVMIKFDILFNLI